MFHRVIAILLSLLLNTSLADHEGIHPFKNPNYVPGREVMVHLFEWKWKDIANECENFLAPKRFAGVQTSPVTENMIIESRPWSERYEPISYKWITRSGNEDEFKDMVRRCNRVGVRIYVDAVLNHMTENKEQAVGTGGSIANTRIRSYPEVPYSWSDFNPPCEIEDWRNVTQLRNCQVLGHDLDQRQPKVITGILRLMNKLIDAGVAGFRIDEANHMWPIDLGHIYSRLNPLNPDHGFSETSRPYIYQDITNYHYEVTHGDEYNRLAAVEEFHYGARVSQLLEDVEWTENTREPLNFIPSEDALVFIDNYETQRSTAYNTLTYKSPKLYKMGVAFMLAHPYGNPRIMSSYAFGNVLAGPPADEDDNIISPIIRDDGSCEGGWICEHRWPQIYNMVTFRRAVSGTIIEDWWDNGKSQIGFSRGKIGFIAINGGRTDFIATIPTKLPPGIYCDVISGNLINGTCSGKFVDVDEAGKVHVTILSDEDDGVIAIHRDAKLLDSSRGGKQPIDV